MGVTKRSFVSLQTHWLISTAIFLKFRIFLIILVEQIYMVTLKLDNTCNAHTGDERRCALKNHQNHTKNHGHNFFLQWDSRYGPYDEDFTQNVHNFDHYMLFLSTHLLKGGRKPKIGKVYCKLIHAPPVNLSWTKSHLHWCETIK